MLVVRQKLLVVKTTPRTRQVDALGMLGNTIRRFGALLFWGVGAHLGRPWAQNKDGHVLSDVTDLGKDLRDPTAVLPRLKAAYARWEPHERKLLLKHGERPRSQPPWH